jgi:hypothetical protein
MDSASETKSLRLPIFDGIYKKFQIWWEQFIAFATVFKFTKALKIGGESAPIGLKDADTIDEMTSIGKKQAAAKKRNVIAMANLMMAFTSETTTGLLCGRPRQVTGQEVWCIFLWWLHCLRSFSHRT